MKYLILLFGICSLACEQASTNNEISSEKNLPVQETQEYDPSCEWCGAAEAPENLSWKTTIAGPDEPGEDMIISGTVYQKDGKTPAPDVIVYVYHTNWEGKYPRSDDLPGNGKRHGYLRGWMKTDAQGRYMFKSIRPAAYKSEGGEPAHIHYVIKAPGQEEYWLNALIFSDDPRVKDPNAVVERDGGFSHITDMVKNEDGVWIGERDIMIQEF